MYRMFTRSAVVALLLLGVMAAVAGSALADPGTGAQTGGGPISVNDCSDDGYSTICYTAQGESHYVYTPTGGYNTQINLQQQCYTVTDDTTGAIVYQDCIQNGHEQIHTDKAGDTQVVHLSYGETTTYEGTTYCFSAQYHEANGQVQYDNFSSTC